jgi:predicted phosphodiesterase
MINDLDSFGSGSADEDIARWIGDSYPLFIETPLIKDYLKSSFYYPFLSGIKGIGKSLLLFRKAIFLSKDPDKLVVQSEDQKIFTPSLDFAELVRKAYIWNLIDKENPQFETWAKLWEWAILKSILSTWIDYLKSSKGSDSKVKVLSDLLQGEQTHDPFESICKFLYSLELGFPRKKGFLVLPETSNLRNFVKKHYNYFPKTSLLIDNQDDFFEYNPDFWINSGYGTFRAIIQISRYTNHRVECFATIRPEIIWELKDSQHFPMWESLIFYLKWKDEQLIDLLNKRASRLKRDLLRDPSLLKLNPFLAFLGPEFASECQNLFVIRNSSVEDKDPIYEKASDYILRHSLRRPRDLILIANSILNTRKNWDHKDTPNYEIIRIAVDNAASKIIAKGYIEEVRHRWPWGINGNAFLSIEGFLSRYVRKNILSKFEAVQIQKQFSNDLKLSELAHPICQLCAFGLIGWEKKRDNGELYQYFLTPGEETLKFIPGDVEWFFVHPILYKGDFHINVVKGIVVGPGLSIDKKALKKLSIRTDFKYKAIAHDKTKKEESIKNTIRILHLSDFHFSKKSEWESTPVLNELVSDLSNLMDEKLNPDLVVISGDITQGGKKADFNKALQWIEKRLIPTLGINNKQLFLVPGNHDLERIGREKTTKAYLTDIIENQKFDELSESFQDERTKNQIIKPFRNFLNCWKNFGPKNIDKSLPWWSTAVVIREKRIFLSGICSSLMSGLFKDDKGKLLLSRYQIYKIFENKFDYDLSITIMHHPWSYLDDFEESNLKDTIRQKSNILLTGHCHKLDHSIIERPNQKILEFSCGSCYQNSNFPNTYHLIEVDFLKKIVSVHMRIWDGTAWIADRNRFHGSAPRGKHNFKFL